MTEPTPNELLATPNLVVNPSVSSSRAGRSAEIEKLIWEMVDALGTIDGVAMNDWGEGDPEFVAARAALLDYLEDRTLTAEELGHIRWATRAAGLNEDIAGPIIEKLRRWSSPPATTEELKP